ncbi:MAG: hypothetical protein H6741_21815 [Alphaproteobacteria bacterium]|nr:hypothetical protein [Alphaproteobacteria bacterium]MCB9795350.1 hypothetical protein [Alphaproteobacteria bacterium]
MKPRTSAPRGAPPPWAPWMACTAGVEAAVTGPAAWRCTSGSSLFGLRCSSSFGLRIKPTDEKDDSEGEQQQALR